MRKFPQVTTMTQVNNNWKYLPCKTFILLSMQVSLIQSACTASTEFGPIICILKCFATYAYIGGTLTQRQNMEQIENGFYELNLCYDEGINLLLDNYDSPSFVVEANSFTADINVKELQYSLTGITAMEVDSMNANAFKAVTKLVFTNTGIDTFKEGLLNGLESLEILHFKDVSDTPEKVIENGVLDVLNQTITEFKFEQSARSLNEIVIDGFTGSAVLSKLASVKYMYNLRNSITNKSFVGLAKVKALDLSYCQIETLGVGAFDAIRNSIEILNLENNFIKTLPNGLFDLILPSYYANIYLEGNHKWICDCDLMPFKINLMEHSSNFIGVVECDSPLEHKTDKVVETNFCEPTTTTELTTEITSEITTDTSTDIPLPDEFSRECFQQGATNAEPKIVTIKMPRQKFSIIQTENIDFVLQIDKPMNNLILIWLPVNDTQTYFTADTKINCLITSSASISITNLLERSIPAYTICLMNSTDKTISPLDCISYAIRDNYHKHAWLNESRKGFVIGMTVIACSVSVLSGVAFGYFTLKTSTNGKQNLDHITSRSDINTKMTTNVIDNNDSAPPLPPRECSMHFEEYGYATVNYVK